MDEEAPQVMLVLGGPADQVVEIVLLFHFHKLLVVLGKDLEHSVIVVSVDVLLSIQ